MSCLCSVSGLVSGVCQRRSCQAFLGAWVVLVLIPPPLFCPSFVFPNGRYGLAVGYGLTVPVMTWMAVELYFETSRRLSFAFVALLLCAWLETIGASMAVWHVEYDFDGSVQGGKRSRERFFFVGLMAPHLCASRGGCFPHLNALFTPLPQPLSPFPSLFFFFFFFLSQAWV